MQSVSELYKSIVAGDHQFECKVEIQGAGTIDKTGIVRIETGIAVFQDAPKVGTAVSAEIDLEVIAPDATIPRMAEIKPQVRAYNSTQTSEWIKQGVFYVDTRVQNVSEHGETTLVIHGYDAMLKAERIFASENITGDSTDVDMVDEIASHIGVDVDARTYDIMTEGYTVPLPTGYSDREVLGYIASMYVGFFIITDEGKLRLVSLLELPPEVNYLVTEDGEPITFGGEMILV